MQALNLSLAPSADDACISPAYAADLCCEYQRQPLAIDRQQPRLFWKMHDCRRGARQTAYHILVATSRERLHANQADLWDTGQVFSDRTTHIPYQGKPLSAQSTCHWKVRLWDHQGNASPWSESTCWTMGLLSPQAWTASWITMPGATHQPEKEKDVACCVSPWLRKTVRLAAAPSQAMAYVNARGYFELYINGSKVGSDVLSPAVSDFAKRTFYVTYDLTPFLRAGDNCIALWLGQGWHAPLIRGVDQPGPLVRAQCDLVVEGKPLRIATDASWKSRDSGRSTIGKWYWNDYGGERCDARIHLQDWNLPSLNDHDWLPAQVCQPQEIMAEAQPCALNRVSQPVTATACETWGGGRWHVIDFGVNLTGWLQLRMHGLVAGQCVRIHYADTIHATPGPQVTPGGVIPVSMGDRLFEYPGGATRAQTFNQYDEYIAAGEGDEVFCSKFNYHGFRYVIIEGLASPPALEDAQAFLIESDLTEAGTFACSNELYNRIHHVTAWTLRCLNLGGLIADCPHRERRGYGDGQATLLTAMLNQHMPTFAAKWAKDWIDAQDPVTGQLPHVAPHMPGGGGPAWCGALATLAWQTYLQYGDREMLQEAIGPMRLFLDHLETHCEADVLRTFGSEWDFIGDWVPPGHGMDTQDWQVGTPAEVFNNCYRVHLWQILQQTALALEDEQLAAHATQKLATMRQRIHHAFYKSDVQTYGYDSQTYRAAPLHVGVVPAEHRDDVINALEHAILVRRKGHLDTGMLGTWFLLEYLIASDRSDLIAAMVSQQDYPGWGYMLAQDATAWWEQWNGYGSRIHSCFASIGAWFTQGIAGIGMDPALPGYKKVIIQPSPLGGLTWAQGEFQGLHGMIKSSWHLIEDRWELQVQIPANTTGRVCLPADQYEAITESGKRIMDGPDVRFTGVHQGRATYEVNAGTYCFSIPRQDYRFR